MLWLYITDGSRQEATIVPLSIEIVRISSQGGEKHFRYMLYLPIIELKANVIINCLKTMA